MIVTEQLSLNNSICSLSEDLAMAGRRPRPSGPRSPRSPRAGRGKRYRDLMKEQEEEAGGSKKQRSAGPADGGVDKVV